MLYNDADFSTASFLTLVPSESSLRDLQLQGPCAFATAVDSETRWGTVGFSARSTACRMHVRDVDPRQLRRTR